MKFSKLLLCASSIFLLAGCNEESPSSEASKSEPVDTSTSVTPKDPYGFDHTDFIVSYEDANKDKNSIYHIDSEAREVKVDTYYGLASYAKKEGYSGTGVGYSFVEFKTLAKLPVYKGKALYTLFGDEMFLAFYKDNNGEKGDLYRIRCSKDTAESSLETVGWLATPLIPYENQWDAFKEVAGKTYYSPENIAYGKHNYSDIFYGTFKVVFKDDYTCRVYVKNQGKSSYSELGSALDISFNQLHPTCLKNTNADMHYTMSQYDKEAHSFILVKEYGTGISSGIVWTYFSTTMTLGE